MTKLIIAGHAGYGSAMKRNISMLAGEVPDIISVDFDEDDDLEQLREKYADVLKKTEGYDVLFACDLPGGTPFREAAMICHGNDNYAVIAGLNTSAYVDIAYSLHLSPKELAVQAADVAKASVVIFAAGQQL